ncbi:MAG: hypothetical protein LIO95_04385 [Clostridiales bacterium]|nr:hypothetical protein [Clostridiales bacterium]
MDEKKTTETAAPVEYLTEKEARAVKALLKKSLRDYKKKPASMTDQVWLERLFVTELPELPAEEARQDAAEIVTAIETFDEDLQAVDEAATHGVSKESWLADKLQESSVGMSVNEYGRTLQAMDDVLYQANMEMADALQRSSDGHIKMSPNLDGNIAEQMVAKSTELSASLQGKNIKVEVRDAYTKNSVDVRATNLETGEYQNYQLKFGKDAKATIDLIERGNYNNQRIVVPADQLEEVQAHFKAKGSNKTITNHIDAWGAEGKAYTKEEMKALQEAAQEDGIMPSMDYSHYQTRDLAMSIGKNAGVMALQSAAVTTGLNIAKKVFEGEEVDPDELVEAAIKTGADTSVKVVTAGTLQVAIRKGILSVIPKTTPAGIIANVACVGVENVKILGKIASGELSLTRGLDRMSRVTTSMAAGLWQMAKGAAFGAKLAAWIPVIGAPLSVVSGLVGGMVGYMGGSKLGEAVHSAGKKVAGVAKTVAKSAVRGVKRVASAAKNTIGSFARGFTSLLGF